MQTASTNHRSNVKNRTRARGQVLARHSHRASVVKTRSCIELGKCNLKSASDRGYIDEPVMRTTGSAGAKHYFHRNQQYSVTAITDGSGGVSERYAYSAYGTPTITDASGAVRATTAIGNRYAYTGREWDETLALYHYRARMYDSVAGRFVSRDPIGYFDFPSLYFAGFIGRGTDPTGFSTFIHPDDIDTLDGCASWEQERVADCYSLLGPIFVNNEYLDCISAARDAAKDCRKRNFMKGGGIFICTRNVRDSTPCARLINSCGGQHTYIQFGETDEDGRPCDGTTGCGFSGGTVDPGVTLPSEEMAFDPSSCTRLNLPDGTSYSEAKECIQNYPIQHEYSSVTYSCGDWANDAVDHCGLSRGDSVSF